MDPGAILANQSYQLAYWTVLIVLILLIAYYVSGKSAEHLDTSVAGLKAQILQPLAVNPSPLAQTFTSTNQSEYTSPYNAQVLASAPLLPSTEQEMLVNQGGYPDFWSISGELDAYKAQTAAAWAADAANKVSGDASVGSEHMSSTPISNLIDTQLASGFYPGASTF